MAAGLWVSPLVGGYKSCIDDITVYVKVRGGITDSAGGVLNFLAAATVLSPSLPLYLFTFFSQLYHWICNRKAMLCGPCVIIFHSHSLSNWIWVHCLLPSTFNFLFSVCKTTALWPRQGTPEGANPQNYSLALISVLMLLLKESVVTINLSVKWQLIKSQLSPKPYRKTSTLI